MLRGHRAILLSEDTTHKLHAEALPVLVIDAFEITATLAAMPSPLFTKKTYVGQCLLARC